MTKLVGCGASFQQVLPWPLRYGSIMRIAWLMVMLFGQMIANAKIPDEYSPIVVEAPFSLSERVFDLSAAIAKAKREDKALFIYLGAADCPPCKEYSRFLETNREQLKSGFDKVIVVDIRTWLKGSAPVFKVDEKRYTFAEFQSLVGDPNKSLSYPYYWYVTPAPKQIKQIPRGSANYLSVEKHLDILRAP